jgi:putative component of membrane protein insertase Oxa1/YidC/SpoIIIJ protein YidD
MAVQGIGITAPLGLIQSGPIGTSERILGIPLPTAVSHALPLDGHDTFESVQAYQPPANVSGLSKLALKAINVYQAKYSRNPDTPKWMQFQCAYAHLGTLSCSEYGKRAYQTHGFLKASFLTTVRMLSCNPLMLWPAYRVAAKKRLGWVRNQAQMVNLFPNPVSNVAFNAKAKAA